MELKKKKKD